MSDVISRNQGTRGDYRWLETWAYPLSLKQVVGASPDIVLGRRVLVTAFDAGPLALTEDEALSGWTRIKDFPVSPVVKDVDQLPDTDQYDEWYVFDHVPAIDSIHVFVTYTHSFQLLAGRPSAETSRDLLERFWRQVEVLRPVAYLACNENAFLFVCRDADLYKLGAEACRRLIAGTKPLFPVD